ncbi:unnamed protein product [Amoebophrya sp. A25]|nr:unnamed protein product [Amoebophrya sp. A25]|eukprot:GSA25T00004385001.1
MGIELRGAGKGKSKIWCICEPAGTICVILAYSIIISCSYVTSVKVIGTYSTLPFYGVRVPMQVIYLGVVGMAVWAHLACMLTDPGAVPLVADDPEGGRALDDFCTKSAVDVGFDLEGGPVKMCRKCQQRKPNRAHHCSICKRCIMKMDHHCPWVNNCVGQYNQKHFLLFLMYIFLMSSMSLGIIGVRTYDCISYSGRMFENWSTSASTSVGVSPSSTSVGVVSPSAAEGGGGSGESKSFAQMRRDMPAAPYEVPDEGEQYYGSEGGISSEPLGFTQVLSSSAPTSASSVQNQQNANKMRRRRLTEAEDAQEVEDYRDQSKSTSANVLEVEQTSEQSSLFGSLFPNMFAMAAPLSFTQTESSKSSSSLEKYNRDQVLNNVDEGVEGPRGVTSDHRSATPGDNDVNRGTTRSWQMNASPSALPQTQGTQQHLSQTATVPAGGSLHSASRMLTTGLEDALQTVASGLNKHRRNMRKRRGYGNSAEDDELCEPNEWTLVGGILVLFMGATFALFTCAMSCDQVSAITSDQTLIEKLQAKRQEKEVREEAARKESISSSSRDEGQSSHATAAGSMKGGLDAASGGFAQATNGGVIDVSHPGYIVGRPMSNERGDGYQPVGRSPFSHHASAESVQKVCFCLPREIVCCETLCTYCCCGRTVCCCGERDGSGQTGARKRGGRRLFVRAMAEVCGSGKNINWRWFVPFPVKLATPKAIV